jgi:eukaryotic-like serine/threonine-protein kinase
MAKWQPEPDALVAERFKLVRELGRGGMGAVWVAHHEGLDIECALKFIVGEGEDEERRSRFRQEARAAAKLKCRNVVQMLDHGLWKDTPYIAMELLRGEALSDRLDRRQRLDPDETLAIAKDVARALAAAAELGIVHRDLKPDNVFLARDGTEELAKVLDFGIAKTTRLANSDHRTRTGALLGTPHYMSPEQLDGTVPVDHRADLWSLAVIVYECLVGALPFDEESLPRLMMAIMQGPIPTPSKVAPWLGPSFDRWWTRGASRDVNGRFRTAADLMAGLAQALADGPLSSSDDPTERKDVRELLAAAGAVAASRAADGTLHSAEAPARAAALDREIADAPTELDEQVAAQSAVTPGGTLLAATGRTRLGAGTLGGQATPSFRERRRRVIYGFVVLGVVAMVAAVWAASVLRVAEGPAPVVAGSLDERTTAEASAHAPPLDTASAAPTGMVSATPDPSSSAEVKPADAKSAHPAPVPRPTPPPRRPRWK